MEMLMETYRPGLVQTAESIFKAMLDTDVAVLKEPAEAVAPHLTAAVYYAGAWQGALVVTCSEAQAREWSSRIMGIDDPTPLDARDGLGELTNVLAGNLKPLLPPGVSISVPSVVDGSDYRLRVCGGNQTERIDLADATGPFSITLTFMPPRPQN